MHGLFADVSRRQSGRPVPKLANPSEEGICAMARLYSTKVTASGGRHGSIRSEDGLLDLKLALPCALGGRGDATNPEQLFASGYAACFENPLLHVSRDASHRFADDDVDVVVARILGRLEELGYGCSLIKRGQLVVRTARRRMIRSHDRFPKRTP
jgi:Ohr subfamily peroxiredoxin